MNTQNDTIGVIIATIVLVLVPALIFIIALSDTGII